MEIGKLCNLLEDFDKGVPMSLMSDRYGVTRQTISVLAKGHGLPPRKSTGFRVCPGCGVTFTKASKSKAIYCGQPCYIKHQLGNPDSEYSKTHRRKGLSIRQKQRLAREVAKSICEIKPDWIIHHIDEDLDNREPSNLYVFLSQSKHLAYHHRLRKDRRCLPLATDGFNLGRR